MAAIGIFAVVRWVIQHPLISKEGLPAGYIVDTGALEREYASYYGKPLDDSRVGLRFRAAAEAAARRNAAGAASVLETIATAGAVPVMFHDLGVAYIMLGDYARAADAFRDVLARDPAYPPTRKYLRDSKAIAPGLAEPYTREQEPNNDNMTANLIALRSAVSGELTGPDDNADYFRVIAPAAPRDLLTIEIANHSPNLAPRVRVYDANLRILSWGDKLGRAGESLGVTGGPAPNSSLYIAVSAAESDGGSYLLTVTPQKASDKYEPNDDILSSTRISIGEEVAASVMDGEDRDFFSFASPRKGTVAIELRNRSMTLVPDLTAYDNDRHNMGSAREVPLPGGNLHYTLGVEKGLTYYLQISSQHGTSGDYTLRVD